MKDLLEANHWELSDKSLTADFHQHNPLVASGRHPMVEILYVHTQADAGAGAYEYQDRWGVAVVAEGDQVVVVTPRELPSPRNPGARYTTTSRSN